MGATRRSDPNPLRHSSVIAIKWLCRVQTRSGSGATRRGRHQSSRCPLRRGFAPFPPHFEIEEIVEREPYLEIEHQSRRAYIFARRLKGGANVA
jgi:hypothetical protein